MRFLADESCDFSVVRALRSAGHDVLAVAELASGSDDAMVMNLALRERRVLLTEDKDFGQLVFAHSHQSGGVIFIRYPANARGTLPEAILALAAEGRTPLTGNFVVISPGRIRIGGRTR